MKKLTTQEFIERASKVHNNTFDYSLTNYINSKHKVTIICKHGHKVDQNPNDHLRGIGCKVCHRSILGNIARRPLEEVKTELINKYKGRYSFDFTGYVNTDSIISIECKDHGVTKIRAQQLLRGYECTECKGTKPGKLTLEYFLRKVKQIHGDFYSYKNTQISGSKTKIEIVCPTHGSFFQSANAHLRGQGCPKCKSSKGETRVRLWLETNNIPYKSQHRFDKLKRYSYDFYLPTKNICIEYDGEYHYNSYKRVGGEEGLKKRQNRDKAKTDFCYKNNIHLIRIPYWDFNKIEEILKKYLLKN